MIGISDPWRGIWDCVWYEETAALDAAPPGLRRVPGTPWSHERRSASLIHPYGNGMGRRFMRP